MRGKVFDTEFAATAKIQVVAKSKAQRVLQLHLFNCLGWAGEAPNQASRKILGGVSVVKTLFIRCCDVLPTRHSILVILSATIGQRPTRVVVVFVILVVLVLNHLLVYSSFILNEKIWADIKPLTI